MIRPIIRQHPRSGGHYAIVPKPSESGYIPLRADSWPATWPERPETHNAYGFRCRSSAWEFAEEIAREADQ